MAENPNPTEEQPTGTETEPKSEPTTEPTTEPQNPKENDGQPTNTEPDLSKYDLDTLKEQNPAVAKALSEADEIRKQNEKDQKAREEEDRKQKEQDGQWQELANDNEKKFNESESKREKTQEKLDKAYGTIESVLAEMEKDIPDDKKSLIPEDFSPRQKLEYIQKNREALGSTPASKGGSVPKNKENHPHDKEGQLTQEYDDLKSKLDSGTATRIDQNRMLAIGDELKELQANKQ